MKASSALSRRSFLGTSSGLAALTALGTLTNLPPFVQRAIAEGSIGIPSNGRVKKLLFIFLRGANDGLNSVMPYGDDAYWDFTTGASRIRPDIAIRPDPNASPLTANGRMAFPEAGPTNPTFGYPFALPIGNGFAGLHPSLKFLAPIYNDGQLAMIHRVGYPRQSRSHFDSQLYWETASPGGALKDGVLYRAMLESGRTGINALTGVSFQSSLPLVLRGSRAAMTNLSDPSRYDLLGVPNTIAGNAKATRALAEANAAHFADKASRGMLSLQYQNMASTLETFAQLNFGAEYLDDVNTDGHRPYNLFPSSNATNGGGTADKYVIPTGAYDLMRQLKSAAIVLNKTDAIVAGTQIDGWDTHGTQATVGNSHLGSHANLLRRVGWSMYALQKYFRTQGDKCRWEDVAVITLSEFGRTTLENSDNGTDHAEASVMWVAGGSVKGLQTDGTGRVTRTGMHNCGGSDPVAWQPGMNGSMFQSTGRYLKRTTDFRSLLGKVIRDHLGATQDQLNRIIPGYTVAGERLRDGGTQSPDNAQITGELDIV
jgi:uncharacterized protein (DUF1501 family)